MNKYLKEQLGKVREVIWYERLFYFPIRLVVAYLVYANFEHGLFFIAIYILFRLGEVSARQYITAQEFNIAIQNLNTPNYEQERLESLYLKELEERLSALELQTIENEIAREAEGSGD